MSAFSVKLVAAFGRRRCQLRVDLRHGACVKAAVTERCVESIGKFEHRSTSAQAGRGDADTKVQSTPSPPRIPGPAGLATTAFRVAPRWQSCGQQSVDCGQRPTDPVGRNLLRLPDTINGARCNDRRQHVSDGAVAPDANAHGNIDAVRERRRRKVTDRGLAGDNDLPKAPLVGNRREFGAEAIANINKLPSR